MPAGVRKTKDETAPDQHRLKVVTAKNSDFFDDIWNTPLLGGDGESDKERDPQPRKNKKGSPSAGADPVATADAAVRKDAFRAASRTAGGVRPRPTPTQTGGASQKGAAKVKSK